MLQDKPWYKSLTLVGGGIFAALQLAEQTGQVPPGSATTAAQVASAIAGLVSLFGMRRAVSNAAQPPPA